jgi:hypothetical protein
MGRSPVKNQSVPDRIAQEIAVEAEDEPTVGLRGSMPSPRSPRSLAIWIERIGRNFTAGKGENGGRTEADEAFVTLIPFCELDRTD